MDTTREKAIDTSDGGGASRSMVLELVGVSVHYRAVVALDTVSLGARKGELVAVMGPNGQASPPSSRQSWVWPP